MAPCQLRHGAGFGRGGGGVSVLPPFRLATRARTRAPLRLSFWEGGWNREHLDGRFDVTLRAHRAESCLWLVLTRSQRRQQRRDDDPPRRPGPPSVGFALHSARPL